MRISNEPTFKGINIAKVAEQNIRIYDVTARDAEFLEHVYQRVNIKKLMPNISSDGAMVYDSIMRQGLRAAQAGSSHAMLLSYNDTVCGFIVDSPNLARQNVDYICTWPIEKNKKAPFGAQTLFQQLFKKFLKTDKVILELDAVRYGKAISLYQGLGFRAMGGDAYYENMRATKDSIKKTLEKLNQKIQLVQISNANDIDLEKELKIP